MFGIDFYPTPKEVVYQMLQGVDVRDKVVLEPSAGSGNIVEVLKEMGAKKILVCELDPTLRRGLPEYCTILGEDCMKLTKEDLARVDLVVMNPPFSNAEQHIMHLWECAYPGTEIITLCNDSTISNPWTKIRSQIHEIVKFHGYSENLGRCFSDADRSTDVVVSMIRLWKPGSGSMEFEDYFMDDIPEVQAEGLMQYDAVRDIVNRYVEAMRRFDEVMGACTGINELTSGFSDCGVRFGAFSGSNPISREEFRVQLQGSAWATIFKKLDMSRYVTSSVRSAISRFIEIQSKVPFTMRNIYSMLSMLVATQENRMQKTLCEAFDWICGFSPENSTAGESWKTNSDYMINRRFIVPNITSYGDYGIRKDWVDIGYRYNTEKMDDIVRALCYLTGVRYMDSMSLYQCVRENSIPWGSWFTWVSKEVRKGPYGTSEVVSEMPVFFRFRGYKKGTMHFEFLDEDVWRKFNTAVARVRGWALPKNCK